RGVPSLGPVDLGQTDWERRLIQRLRELHYAWRTEETYRGWAWRYHDFLGGRGRELEKGRREDLRAFLSELAVKHRISVATQKQALNALVFLRVEQAGHTAHIATFLRHAIAGKRHGYPDGAGFTGACGRQHDANLYARDAEARVGSEKSAGWVRIGEGSQEKAKNQEPRTKD